MVAEASAEATHNTKSPSGCVLLFGTWRFRESAPQKAEPPKMNSKKKKALVARFSDGSPSAKMMISTLEEWDDAKHRDPSREEVDFVNSIEVTSCPYCGSVRIRKDGFAKKTGLAIRECKDCRRKFNPLAGTVFDSRKIPITEWVEYLSHVFEYHSIRTSARDNRNVDTTGHYWLCKIFLVLREWQSATVLSGKIWIDETYFPKWPSETEEKDGRKLRGLSRNQLCVCSMTDRRRCVLILCGVGKPSERKVMRSYAPHIAEGSKIVHDGENAHGILIERLGLESEVHPTSETKGLSDGRNPMRPINKVHSYLAGFMGAHSGFDRADMQDWLNLFSFLWSTKGDYEQKARAFIELAVKKRTMLRYREWGKRKKPDGK